MKKYLISASVLTAVIFLSGCSLMPAQQSTQNQAEKTYTVSQSFWKSIDNGTSWQAKTTVHQNPSTTDWNIIRIEIDPTNADIIYAGLKTGGVMKSEDGGETWNTTNFISERPYAMEIDPTNDKILYVSGILEKRGKLFKTEDQGANWKEIYTMPADGPFITYSAMDKSNPRVLYVGTTEGQIIKTIDGGNTWTNIFKGNASILKIISDKSNASALYVLTTNGTLYRTRDGGKSFEDITTKIGMSGVLTVETDPGIANGVYVAGGGGIWRSNNAGDLWEKVNSLSDPGRYPITALAINPQNSREMIYAAAGAVYKSVDGGSSWETHQFDVPKFVSVIKYNFHNPSSVYLGFKK
jgi:photosystem II stability/assembly factor-like uncharacterized protein